MENNLFDNTGKNPPFRGVGGWCESDHPLSQFRFCPVCGENGFSVRNEKAKQCTACGFVYYFNPSASVACFITNPSGELLLVRRAKDPAKDTLDLPGGFLDMYENAEEAVAREVLEETGLHIRTASYLFSLPNIYPYMGFHVHTLDLFYECTVDSFEGIRAADDAAEVVTLPFAAIDPEEIGLTSVRRAVTLYLDRMLSR
ncbi:MAG: NUDIX domain-containing protein [Tannerellaceae bacterium]|nr:NUDIX domain-containing protein [Tannerellaceae bacterium]